MNACRSGSRLCAGLLEARSAGISLTRRDVSIASALCRDAGTAKCGAVRSTSSRSGCGREDVSTTEIRRTGLTDRGRQCDPADMRASDFSVALLMHWHAALTAEERREAALP